MLESPQSEAALRLGEYEVSFCPIGSPRDELEWCLSLAKARSFQREARCFEEQDVAVVVRATIWGPSLSMPPHGEHDEFAFFGAKAEVDVPLRSHEKNSTNDAALMSHVDDPEQGAVTKTPLYLVQLLQEQVRGTTGDSCSTTAGWPRCGGEPASR